MSDDKVELYTVVKDLLEKQARTDIRVEHVERDVADIKRDTRETRDAIVKAKGGWKVLVAVGAVSGMLSAFLVKFVPFLIKP